MKTAAVVVLVVLVRGALSIAQKVDTVLPSTETKTRYLNASNNSKELFLL